MTVAEIIEDAEQREARNANRRAELEARFQGLAAGREWFSGIFPHQWSAICYGAVAKRWFLGDEPGAGKTRSSIGWLDIIGAKKVILVAEANVCAQFAGEIMDLAPHRTILNLAGLTKDTRHKRLNALIRQQEGVAVVNYEMFRQDQNALGKLLMWQADTVIVDEAHNIKNIKTSNYRNVEKIVLANNSCPSCHELMYGLDKRCESCGWINPYGSVRAWNKEIAAKPTPKEASTMMLSTKSVQNLLLMTGTPVLNSPVDLFSIFHLIDPIRFPSETWFKQEFTHPDYSMNRHVFSRKGLDKLTPLMKGRYLARTLEEVGIYLPKQRVHVMRVEIDPKRYPLQARTITQISKHAAIQLSTGESTTLIHMIQIILRKRQANTYPAGIEIKDPNTGEVLFSVGKEVQESAKFDVCEEQIAEYHKQGRRQVVFSQFQGALAAFEVRLKDKGYRVARFDGTTPAKIRDEIKNDFREVNNPSPKWDIVLVHYRTGGTGVTLNGGTVIHCLDEEWNAGKEAQARARIRRIGQDKETDCVIYRAPGVDVWMSNLIAMKAQMVSRLGEAMSAEKQVRLIADQIRKDAQ